MPPVKSLNTSSIRRAVRELSTNDSHIAAVIDRWGQPPLWARPPGFSTLVRIVLEQQVTLASGKAAYERFQGVVGRVSAASVERSSEAQLRRAGLTRQKAGYCRGLATAVRDGSLDLERIAVSDDDEARTVLMAIRGVGKWTGDIYLLMALGRPDVWPDGDLALAKSMQRVKRLRTMPDADKQRRIARAWRPWRAVAARVLWHTYLCEQRQG